MIEEAKGFPDCALPVVPAFIKPIGLALATHDPDIVVAGLNALQKVVLSNGVGEAMVPFYRQLLQPMNLFYTKRQTSATRFFMVSGRRADMGTVRLDVISGKRRCTTIARTAPQAAREDGRPPRRAFVRSSAWDPRPTATGNATAARTFPTCRSTSPVASRVFWARSLCFDNRNTNR